MNPNIVAGLVKRAYPNFDMFSFNNRLRLQKFVYFLQHGFDLNIGYEFSWYTYGPYCMELTKDAFQADFANTPQIKFGGGEAEKKFETFLLFFNRKKEDNRWLEIASSAHLLSRLFPKIDEKEIVSIIENKHSNFKGREKEIKAIMRELKELRLM